jgi:hypothetical protein
MSERGIQDQTITQLCAMAGIPRVTFYSRLRRGWSQEKALATPVRQRRSISSPGIGRKLRAAGIGNVTYQARRSRGWTEKDAVSVPVGAVKGRKADLRLPDGRPAVHVAERNGVHRRTFYRRVNKGVPVERAVLP